MRGGGRTFYVKGNQKKPEKPDSEGEEDGLRVVKTKIFVKNFGITGEFLEETIRSFTIDYRKIIKVLEGEAWKLRYAKHLKRLSNSDLHLVVGMDDKINMFLRADKVSAN